VIDDRLIRFMSDAKRMIALTPVEQNRLIREAAEGHLSTWAEDLVEQRDGDKEAHKKEGECWCGMTHKRPGATKLPNDEASFDHKTKRDTQETPALASSLRKHLNSDPPTGHGKDVPSDATIDDLTAMHGKASHGKASHDHTKETMPAAESRAAQPMPAFGKMKSHLTAAEPDGHDADVPDDASPQDMADMHDKAHSSDTAPCGHSHSGSASVPAATRRDVTTQGADSAPIDAPQNLTPVQHAQHGLAAVNGLLSDGQQMQAMVGSHLDKLADPDIHVATQAHLDGLTNFNDAVTNVGQALSGISLGSFKSGSTSPDKTEKRDIGGNSGNPAVGDPASAANDMAAHAAHGWLKVASAIKPVPSALLTAADHLANLGGAANVTAASDLQRCAAEQLGGSHAASWTKLNQHVNGLTPGGTGN
jgi:hypothetical protein